MAITGLDLQDLPLALERVYTQQRQRLAPEARRDLDATAESRRLTPSLFLEDLLREAGSIVDVSQSPPPTAEHVTHRLIQCLEEWKERIRDPRRKAVVAIMESPSSLSHTRNA